MKAKCADSMDTTYEISKQLWTFANFASAQPLQYVRHANSIILTSRPVFALAVCTGTTTHTLSATAAYKLTNINKELHLPFWQWPLV